MYELYDPCTTMFFYRNKHIMIDLGTGNNNKINWALKDKQEMIDIIETVYRGAKKGRGLVVSPKDYSTKWNDRSVQLISPSQTISTFATKLSATYHKLPDVLTHDETSLNDMYTSNEAVSLWESPSYMLPFQLYQ
eukprot:g17533.t1